MPDIMLERHHKSTIDNMMKIGLVKLTMCSAMGSMNVKKGKKKEGEKQSLQAYLEHGPAQQRPDHLLLAHRQQGLQHPVVDHRVHHPAAEHLLAGGSLTTSTRNQHRSMIRFRGECSYTRVEEQESHRRSSTFCQTQCRIWYRSFGIESRTTNQICPFQKPHRPTRRMSELVAIPESIDPRFRGDERR